MIEGVFWDHSGPGGLGANPFLSELESGCLGSFAAAIIAGADDLGPGNPRGSVRFITNPAIFKKLHSVTYREPGFDRGFQDRADVALYAFPNSGNSYGSEGFYKIGNPGNKGGWFNCFFFSCLDCALCCNGKIDGDVFIKVFVSLLDVIGFNFGLHKRPRLLWG